MADPITLGIGLLSAAVGGISSMSESAYKQEVAQYNSELAEANAKRALETGQIKARNQDYLTGATLGEQVAAQSASGISVDSRSFIQTRAGARELGRLDALNVLQDAEVEAFNYRTQQSAFQAEKQGAANEGFFGLLGAGLSGAGALAGSLKPASLIGGSSSSWMKWPSQPRSLLR